MFPNIRVGWARLPMLVAGASLASVLMAAAQTWPPADEPAMQEAEEIEAVPAADEEDILKDIDVSKLDWSLLDFDSSNLGEMLAAAQAGLPPKGANGAATAWSSSERANGTSAVSVRQSISPFWDARIGADMTVARQGTMTTSEQLSERLANGGNLPQSSGSAWAAITAPGVASIWDQTSVEARVDPASDQSRLGTSLSKSLPVGEHSSLTLRNDYNLIQQGIVPVPGIISHPSRSTETDQSARLSVTDTGTSFVAGQTSTGDDKWLRKVGAEQKLFDGVTISGSIGETPAGTANKSISAGFRRSW
jgi:hypothetical protein